jgi:23S rRNA (guanosine2251-2'-O)-methyltransferase
LRSASFFGVDSVIIPKNNSADFLNTAVIETSTGGIYDLQLFKATNINLIIEHLKKDGFWVSGFSEHAESPLEKTRFEGKNALILGNEEKGLRKLVEKNCDQLLKISKHGQISSLNVAVSTAIALFELKKNLRF